MLYNMLHAVLKGAKMLILNNISKQYPGSNKEALKNINLKFADKGMVCILGPSGCGKSTLLNLIGCLDTPSTGYVMVEDKVMNNFSKREINYYHHQYVGFIYQNYNLIDYLNVVDNIELINKNPYISKLLDYLSLFNKKNKNVKALSGGERQRVSIARALVNDPQILLCDEPTGALDSLTSEKIITMLKNISEEKLVIVVTHNQELAKRYADRIITLKDGEVVEDTKKIIKNDIKKYESRKVKINRQKIINIIIKNMINKYKRNLLSILAFSVGLISLAIVLGISKGFNQSMEVEEKNSLSRYPIYISENSTNLENDIQDIFKTAEKKNENLIYSTKENHKNTITKEYVQNLNVLNNNLEYQINTYLIDNKLITTTNKKIEDLNILAGSNIESSHDILLVVNNNGVSREILESINLNKDIYTYEEIIGHQFKVNKMIYKIVGIASLKKDSYLSEIHGLLCVNEKFSEIIPISIALYPKNYQTKKKIIDYLNQYPDITYTDYSTTIKNLSTTFVDAVSVVLLAFSLISLLVSTIMIGIISYISVMERIKEIGILKSLGLSNKYVKRIFLGENIILAIIASILSIAVSSLLSIPINNLFYNFTGLGSVFLIDTELFALLLAVSIILSILGSFLPVRKTKKLKIVDCLKYDY